MPLEELGDSLATHKIEFNSQANYSPNYTNTKKEEEIEILGKKF